MFLFASWLDFNAHGGLPSRNSPGRPLGSKNNKSRNNIPLSAGGQQNKNLSNRQDENITQQSLENHLDENGMNTDGDYFTPHLVPTSSAAVRGRVAPRISPEDPLSRLSVTHPSPHIVNSRKTDTAVLKRPRPSTSVSSLLHSVDSASETAQEGTNSYTHSRQNNSRRHEGLADDQTAIAVLLKKRKVIPLYPAPRLPEWSDSNEIFVSYQTYIIFSLLMCLLCRNEIQYLHQPKPKLSQPSLKLLEKFDTLQSTWIATSRRLPVADKIDWRLPDVTSSEPIHSTAVSALTRTARETEDVGDLNVTIDGDSRVSTLQPPSPSSNLEQPRILPTTFTLGTAGVNKLAGICREQDRCKDQFISAICQSLTALVYTTVYDIESRAVMELSQREIIPVDRMLESLSVCFQASQLKSPPVEDIITMYSNIVVRS